MTDDQKEFVALAEEIIARITESHKDPVSNSWPIFGVEGSAPNCWWHDLTGMSKSLEILRRRIQPREEGKPWNYPAFLVTELSANHPPKDITTESLFSKHLARLREVLREKDYIGYMVMLTRDPLVNNSDKIRPLSTLFQYPALNPETNKFEGLEYKIHPDINEYTEYAVTILRRWIRVMSMQPGLADTFRDSPGGCPNENESSTVDKPSQVNLSKWALATEDGQTWHLCHERPKGWWLSGKVDIPASRCRRLAQNFIEEGGALTKTQAIDLLGDSGVTRQKVWDSTVKPAMRDLRRVVKKAIGRIAKCDPKNIADPFPYNKTETTYRAAIDTGTVVKDEDPPNRLRFRSSSFGHESP
jgi:hypothetical protein